jgi:hypothetical protein
MSGVIETGLVAGLAQLNRALEARKTELLSELRKLERDIEAAQHTVDTAARVGFRVPASAPGGRRTDDEPGPRTPVAAPPVTPIPAAAAPDAPPDETLAAYAGSLDSLKTLRPDPSIMARPPRVEDGVRHDAADVPTGGPELAAVRDSVAAIAERAAAAAPEPGGRRCLSSRGSCPVSPSCLRSLPSCGLRTGR